MKEHSRPSNFKGILARGMVVLLFSLTSHVLGGQVLPPDAVTLVHRSQVIGYLNAYQALDADPSEAWRQQVLLLGADLLKGRLERNPSTRQFPYPFADAVRPEGYPTWFEGRGEYLVFLQSEIINGKPAWTTLACFHVVYAPNSSGDVVGLLAGSGPNSMSNDEIRRNLLIVINHRGNVVRSARALTILFQTVAASMSDPKIRLPVSRDVRFKEVQALAATIRVGTTRRDIEKMFPQQDGGISFPSSTRYYLGSGVMVEVSFDLTGGAWKPENKVNGSLAVYFSPMHMD